MDLEYMNALKNATKLLGTGKKEPMTIIEIVELESKYNNGNVFPKAFREYLFLAGKYGGTGVVDEDWDELRKDCEEDIKYWGNTLDRPFFVFDKLDSQYSLFFLDEAQEDPACYIFNASWDKEETEPLLKKMLTGSFSNLINESIHRIKNDIPF